MCCLKCLTLSQTTNFKLFQTKTVCRRQFKSDENDRKFSKRVENTVGKRRNCSLRAISPFPTVFSRDLYCRHVKTRAFFGKGLTLHQMTNFWTKFKGLADNKPNATKIIKMMICVFDRVENIVGKGGNAGYQHLLLFPQCFQKASSSGSLKVGIV